jgi:CubicO group peptidase (beta-lactamase class C family)
MPQGPVLETLETIIDRLASGGPGRGQPAVAWGVVVDGGLALSGGRGALRVSPEGDDEGPEPDADSVFRIASMTKSFTAAALLVLRDEGRLGLDDPVAQHVPELAGLRPATADSPDLTLRHLLTMSGGLPTDDPWGDRQQALGPDAFGDLLRAGLTFAWAPGTAFEYSNLGYAVLGRAIANVTGEDYADAVRRLVLDPLGLTSTVYRAQDADPDRLAVGYRRSPHAAHLWTADGPVQGTPGLRSWQELPFDAYGAFAPMGGLFSSVRDLATWVGGFLDAFPPRDDAEGGHPLRRAARREMQQPHRAVPPRILAPAVDEPPFLRGGGYGYGLVAEHDPRWGAVVSHSGGYPGFGSHMRWHPDSGLGVVVLASSTYAPSSATAAQLLPVLLDAGRAAVLEAAGRPAGRRPGTPEGGAPTVRPTTRPAAAAPGTPWPATLAAMEAVEGLLRRWNPSVATALVAENVDLDEPLGVRALRFRQAAALAGPDGALERDGDAPPEHESPAHAVWWLRGALGRVRLEIRLTPHPEPLVQTLAVTPVPLPKQALQVAATTFALHTHGTQDVFPPTLKTVPGLDQAAVLRQLQIARAFAGPCRPGPVIGGDGVRTTTVRFDGERACIELTLEIDPAGALRRVVFGHPEQGFAATD